MSDKDFHVTQEILDTVVRANDIEADQTGTFAIFGCAAIVHHAEDRVDLLTYDLAVRIATHDTGYRHDNLLILRQIIADLEVKTCHQHGDQLVTSWRNVGIQRVPTVDELRAR